MLLIMAVNYFAAKDCVIANLTFFFNMNELGGVKLACKDPTFAQSQVNFATYLDVTTSKKAFFRPLTTCSTTCHFKFTKFKELCVTKLHL